jgi:hypothetical protein
MWYDTNVSEDHAASIFSEKTPYSNVIRTNVSEDHGDSIFMVLSYLITTRCHNPKDQELNLYRREILKNDLW